MHLMLDGKMFEVTRNLYKALKHLRRIFRPRVLWIDALCIHQSDFQERADQVGIMGDIYSQAISVTAFLGEKWEGCDIALDFITKVASQKKLHTTTESLTPRAEINGLNLSHPELRDYLIQFGRQPWWDRVWTVQEFVRAKNVFFQCGSRLLKSSIFREFCENIRFHGRTCCISHSYYRDIRSSEFKVSLNQILSQYLGLMDMHDENHALSFPEVVSSFRNRKATDPRDKIYGMIGLGRAHHHLEFLRIDYAQPAEKLFEDLAISYIQRTQGLEVLSHIFGRRTLQLPSYIPDWNAAVEDWKFDERLNWIGCKIFYDACRNTKAILKRLSASKIALSGLEVDKIKTIHHVRTATPWLSRKEWLQIALSHAEGDSMYFDKGYTRTTAFYRNLVGDMEVTDERASGYVRIKGDAGQKRMDRWSNWFNDSQGETAGIKNTDAYMFEKCYLITILERNFFLTHKGYFGFCPHQAVEGDSVVVLAGGVVPYIIRQARKAEDNIESEDQENPYIFIGDSYVQGIMDGEAFDRATIPESLKEFILE